ncbi:MAG: tRNA (adenosine(37)-N6)-dimethylallyltransferase MiaA [Deltaproteobacteria bacterium]|nr:tRNA (adenosine(37)-N6)-dimethylallyltransferase MiaA [Deltaproteobacteria bacterium]
MAASAPIKNTAKIAALIGPTASGKSEIALDLARQAGAHILSCDSLLVYRDLNVGTAKPGDAELTAVQHHGINLVDAGQPFTAGDYVHHARAVIDRLVNGNTPVLIVGGTGFYLKALLFGVWDAPPTQPEIRASLEAEVAALGPEERARALHAKLAEKDPAYAAKIDCRDVYRVIRALEIIEVTGEPVSSRVENRALQNPLPFACPIFGIRRARAELERRIVARMNAMFAKGLVRETEELLKKYGANVPRALHCVGYEEVTQFLAGHMELAECRERVVISTRQLAKKQMTFFRGLKTGITWFDLPAQEGALRKAVTGSLSADY